MCQLIKVQLNLHALKERWREMGVSPFPDIELLNGSPGGRYLMNRRVVQLGLAISALDYASWRTVDPVCIREYLLYLVSHESRHAWQHLHYGAWYLLGSMLLDPLMGVESSVVFNPVRFNKHRSPCERDAHDFAEAHHRLPNWQPIIHVTVTTTDENLAFRSTASIV